MRRRLLFQKGNTDRTEEFSRTQVTLASIPIAVDCAEAISKFKMGIVCAQKLPAQGGPRERYARRAYLLAAQRRAGFSARKPSGQQVFLAGSSVVAEEASLSEACLLGSALLLAKNSTALPIFNFEIASIKRASCMK
jgi:hypothetical protein